MKRLVPTLILLVSLAIVLASCAGKPPVKPADAPQQPVPTVEPAKPGVNQAELDGLLAQTQAEKKKAFDLKLFEIFPDDYQGANNAYAAAKADYDAGKAPEAKEGLTKTLVLFKDLNAKGIVEYAALKRKDAADMKATALKAGADSAAPQRYEPALAAETSATGAEGSKDYETAIAGYERARILFELAYKRSLASELRDRIGTNGYQAWDSSNFALAEAKYADDERLYGLAGGKEGAADSGKDAANLVAGIDALDESILRYNLVIQKGRQGIALDKKQGSDQVKRQAEDLKAQVAVKDDYAAALDTYQKAISAMAAGDFESAAMGFSESAVAFESVRQAAAEKRARAEEAMKSAADATDSSLKKAQEADGSVVSQPAADTTTQTSPAAEPAPATH